MTYRLMVGLRAGWILFSTSLVVFVVTGLVVLFSEQFPWWGSPMAALDWMSGTNILLGPVAAGLAAMVYAQMTSTRWIFFLRGTRRGVSATLAPGFVLAGAAVVALLFLLATVAITTRAAGSDARLQGLWIVVPTAAVLVGEVLFGAVVGACIPVWWLAPIAAVLVYAVQAAGAWDVISPVLMTGPASTLLSELAFNPRFAFAQGLAGAALGTVCIAFLAIRARTSVSAAVWGVLVLGTAGFLVGWMALGNMGSNARYEVVAIELRCAGGDPQVCLNANTVRPLTAVSRELHREAAPLAAAGIAVPTRFVQWSPQSAADFPNDGVVDFATVDTEASTTADHDDVAQSLATPAPCAAIYTGSPRAAALTPRTVLADWIERQSDPSSTLRLSTHPEIRWLTLPLNEQLAWVKPTYAALLRCDLRSLRPPW